jgi:flagellar biogenesis protein FliO
MIGAPASDAHFSTVALLALVVLLVAALLWWQRSRGTLAGGDAIRLVAVRGLGGKRLLALVEVERERFLLGMTDERIACLARVGAQGTTNDPADAAPTQGAAESAWIKQSA